MKYYSEKLNELFDTPEALEAAENAVKKSCKHKGCTKTDVNNLNDKCDCKDASKNVEGPTKKQLAANVDAAEENLKTAYAEYEVAKKQVEELSKTYLESVEAILTPAKEAVKKAEQERYAAIRKFNESFGAYQVTLTGDRAAKEMMRAINEMNSVQRKVFNNAFWF
jgi:hypothetical protein